MQPFVGTSGYSYKEWKGGFYPEDLPNKDMLSHYASKLNAVEINNTFYRMPKSVVVEKWAADVPDGFAFSMKASRRITHHARLKDTEDTLHFLWRAAAKLGDRLGCVFFQIPPYLHLDMERLGPFLKLMPAEHPVVFQFGHDSWLVDEVYDALRSVNAALCITDNDGGPDPELVATADWGYLRLRRPGYSDAELESWMQRIREQSWKRTFVFFKHEETAPDAANRLSRMGGDQ